MDQEDPQVEELNASLQELKERLSKMRKKGIITKLVDIRIMNVPSKIQMLSVTKDKADYDKVRQILDIAKKETDNEEKYGHEELSKQKEIKQVSDFIKEQDKNEFVVKVNKLIENAYDFIKKNELEDAYHMYIEIRGLYKYLPDEEKKKLFQKSKEIYSLLVNSGLFKRRQVQEKKKKGFFDRFKRKKK